MFDYLLLFLNVAFLGVALLLYIKVSTRDLDQVKKIERPRLYKKLEKEMPSREEDAFATMMHNVDSYDGTPYGQKDIPK